MAFHIAGSMAFKDAMRKGNPVLLEPIMKVEVTMPEEYMGDIIGDINSRRGRIEKTSAAASWLRLMFRWQRCSVILPTFVPELRDVVTTPCSLRNMSRFRRAFRRKFLLEKLRNN